MTFDQIVADICGRMNLVSAEAKTRVGQAVNRHYRRVSATIGLEPVRYVTRTAQTSLASDTLTFTGVEKIDRVFERGSDGIVRTLTPVSVAQLRQSPELQGDRSQFAVLRMAANSITILLPGLALAVVDLYADGWTTLDDMVGADMPTLPESFHDILVFAVVAEEYLRKEKTDLADRFNAQADTLLRELRFHIADAPPINWRQGGHVIGGESGGGSGGSGSSVITGDIVFDRDPGPPFHVTAGSGLVENLDADKLDGQHGSFYQDGVHLSDNTVPLGKLAWTLSSTLLGRGEGDSGPGGDVGDVQRITLGAGLTMTGQTLSAVVAPGPPLAHAPTHRAGGSDPLSVTTLPGYPGTTDVFLRGDGTFAVPAGGGGGGGGTPGGADTQLQFNDAGTFGGDAGLTYAKGTDVLSAAGAVAVGVAPAQSGAVRLANNAEIHARNGANTGDVRIAVVGAGNELVVGDRTAGTTYIDGTAINLRTAAHHILLEDSTAALIPQTDAVTSLGYPTLRWKDGYFSGVIQAGSSITLGTGFGPTPTSGLIRLPNFRAITFRAIGNDYDVQALTVDSSNRIMLGAGEAVVVPGPVAVGPNPAQSGLLRLANQGNVASRNGANSGDVKILGLAADDTLWVGENAIAIRLQQNTIIPNGRVINSRNAADTANITMLAGWSDSKVYVGSDMADAGLVLRSSQGLVDMAGYLRFIQGDSVAISTDARQLTLCGGPTNATTSGAVVELLGTGAPILKGSIHNRLGNTPQAEWRIYHGNGTEVFKVSAYGRIQQTCYDPQYAYWNDVGGTGIYHEFSRQSQTYGYLGNGGTLDGAGSMDHLTLRATYRLRLTADSNQIYSPSIWASAGAGTIGNVLVQSDGRLVRASGLTSRDASGVDTIHDGDGLLAALLRLRPRTLTHAAQARIGLLTDEVAAIDPRFVNDLGSGESQVDLGALVALTTAAVQRLHARVRELERRI